MDSIIVTVERSVFPLTRFFITIGESSFILRPGEVKKIQLPDTDLYDVVASSYWLRKKVSLHLNNNSVLKVKHGIPDIFYLIGMPVITFLSIFTFFHLINMNLLLIALLVYFLPLITITFFKRDIYFKIYSIDEG